MRFYAFALVSAREDGFAPDFGNSRRKQFEFISGQGFDVVEYQEVDEQGVEEAVSSFEERIKTFPIPSDGLVLIYDDIAYGLSLGTTAKFPRDSIAFKWEDETAETTLLEMEWSASRTGLINPVAIFEPVQLEGTTVSRASVHNVSIVKSLELGIGDRLTVYKANMIIPQIAENLTRSGTLPIPDTCPVCGGKAETRQVNDVQFLYCTNPDCDAKKVKAFTLFVSRDALNIDGLSEATLEKFLGRGFLHRFADLFHLDRYREEIVAMDGFGEKSWQNLSESIERARTTTLPRVIYGLGIQNIGLANAKMICREYNDDLNRMMEADVEELSLIDGVGSVIAGTFHNYWQSEKNWEDVKLLLSELTIENMEVDEYAQTLKGLVFVVTGSLNHFDGRSALKEAIEQKGGKVTGSVTGKTTCLINNDSTSNSTKNRKAKDLNVPVLTEEEFMEKYL